MDGYYVYSQGPDTVDAWYPDGTSDGATGAIANDIIVDLPWVMATPRSSSSVPDAGSSLALLGLGLLGLAGIRRKLRK